MTRVYRKKIQEEIQFSMMQIRTCQLSDVSPFKIAFSLSSQYIDMHPWFSCCHR